MTPRVDKLENDVRHDRQDARRGIAAAMAMGSASMPSAPGRMTYVLNGTAYRGEQAAGGSVMYRLNTKSPFAISGGVSYGGRNNTAIRVGIAGEF